MVLHKVLTEGAQKLHTDDTAPTYIVKRTARKLYRLLDKYDEWSTVKL